MRLTTPHILWLFILFIFASSPASSITGLTLWDALQQFPPSTLLACGHVVDRADALLKAVFADRSCCL